METMRRPFYVDTDDYVAAGIDVFTFAGGEEHCKIPDTLPWNVHIFAKIRSSQDLMRLLTVANAIKRSNRQREVHVFLPYFPGARQDRDQHGFPLTTALIAALLKTQVNSVVVADLHSAKARDLIVAAGPKFKSIENDFLAHTAWQAKYSHIVSVDAGGLTRTQHARELCYPRAALVQCVKKRNPLTQTLTDLAIQSSERDIVGGICLLTDDICDGGRTFIGIAKLLYEAGADRVDLAVTHGIFSYGFDPLIEGGIKHVYTTNSYYRGESGEYVTVQDLVPYYFESCTP